MAQQINLYTPILLQPRKQFSAVAMARALLVLIVALVLLGGWMRLQWRHAAQQGEATEARQLLERQQLGTALAGLQQHGDHATLQQQLQGLQQELTQQRQLLAELDRGRAEPGWAHSSLMALVARTVPAAVWVTELNFNLDRIEISGMTLEPPALQGWITQLSQSPTLQGRPLAEVRVEELGHGRGLQGNAQPETLHVANLPTGQAWAFRIAADRSPQPVAATTSQEGQP